ncbi:lysoplasmalogenase [Pedobacter metabolipauper]|uniref:Putative membrane protein YhhN n=1 Tax=Pedobacter metabolipauper TaxID=425513 RepID=A0A4R6SZY5_9SPHI|nr:lysoplasmalogenase [Pedobacter metabolipauper]TDQ11657.1 putative membrane protein YhhN [Pedobacter metabolipauper]
MLKKHLKFNLLFLLIFLLYILADLTHQTTLLYILKPCIALSLLIWLYISTRLKGRFHRRIFTGLIFAMAGDVLLMLVWKNESFFMYGLIAFLICHIFYTRAFYLDFLSAPELDKKGARIAILLCAALSITYYLFIRAHLGAMKLPVLAYTIIISIMMMMAAFRNQRVNSLSFKLILAGAVLFVISDGVLAWYKFVDPNLTLARTVVMATYMAAQYLITLGAVERQLLLKDERDLKGEGILKD